MNRTMLIYVSRELRAVYLIANIRGHVQCALRTLSSMQ